MGMSTWVRGFIPPDEEWQRMKAVWDACRKAGVDPPRAVEKFFGDEYPNGEGRQVELPPECLREWGKDSRAGYEVLVDKLPTNVKVIRFVNAW